MRFGFPSPTTAAAVGVGLLFGLGAQDQAEAQGDLKAGRQKAAEVCAVCHGVDGLAKIAEAPNLAGQNEGYLVEQIAAFKAGQRRNEMMSIVVQSLSPDDIQNLAAYYSAIEISVGKLPAE